MYDVVKTYVTEKIGDLTGLEVMATCPRSSQSKIRRGTPETAFPSE